MDGGVIDVARFCPGDDEKYIDSVLNDANRPSDPTIHLAPQLGSTSSSLTLA